MVSSPPWNDASHLKQMFAGGTAAVDLVGPPCYRLVDSITLPLQACLAARKQRWDAKARLAKQPFPPAHHFQEGPKWWGVSHCFCWHEQRVSLCYAAKPALPAALGPAGNPKEKKEILNWWMKNWCSGALGCSNVWLWVWFVGWFGFFLFAK